MDQTQARRRAQQYIDLGYAAIARTEGGWPKADEEWHVAIGVGPRRKMEFFHEFDVRVTEARDHWTRQYAAKPDAECWCGYDPQTQHDLDTHIKAGTRDDAFAHGVSDR